ncbi:MAG: hypothetical protein HRT65_13560 [Flavobacteriaceae bacterium]|nr:hypothetical protein [Flavobacteriaceae bacterium]
MKRIVTGMMVLYCLAAIAQKQEPMRIKNCVEMVVFRPNQGVSNDSLQQAMRATNAIVKEFDGFLSRTTSMNEAGEFLDVVYWESKAKALEAAEKVQHMPEVMQHFSLIDPKSISMKHFEVFAIQE